MSQRLQVLLDPSELAAIQKIAKRHHMTTAEWVRQTLRAARRSTAGRGPRQKLEAVRAAVRYTFPTADVGQMLHEIEQGYSPEDQ